MNNESKVQDAQLPIEQRVQNGQVLEIDGKKITIVQIGTSQVLIEYPINFNNGDVQGTKNVRSYMSKPELAKLLDARHDVELPTINVVQLLQELEIDHKLTDEKLGKLKEVPQEPVQGTTTDEPKQDTNTIPNEPKEPSNTDKLKNAVQNGTNRHSGG